MNTQATLKTANDVLTLALMAASLASRAAEINGTLAKVHKEGREPTEAEMAGARAAYSSARANLLAHADQIEAAGGVDVPVDDDFPGTAPAPLHG